MLKKLKNYFKYKWLSGHIKMGRLTIYGRNGMHWGVTFWTNKYGYICTRLPLPCFRKWWPWYFYLSPNATPWASTFFIGKKHSFDDWATARLRYKYLGHNFNPDSNKSTFDSIGYFHPGNSNILVDILKRSKAEIKALNTKIEKESRNDLLLSDIERYIKIYGGNDDEFDNEVQQRKE
jgi:hypothetical protein